MRAPASAFTEPSSPRVRVAPEPSATAPSNTNTLVMMAAVRNDTMRVPTAGPNTLAALFAPSDHARKSPLERKNSSTVASDLPLDGVDGQAVGHGLGQVGHLFHQLHVAVQL